MPAAPRNPQVIFKFHVCSSWLEVFSCPPLCQIPGFTRANSHFLGNFLVRQETFRPLMLIVSIILSNFSLCDNLFGILLLFHKLYRAHLLSSGREWNLSFCPLANLILLFSLRLSLFPFLSVLPVCFSAYPYHFLMCYNFFYIQLDRNVIFLWF